MISNPARPLPKENAKAILKPGIFSKQIIPQPQPNSTQKNRSKTPPLHSREFRPKSLINNFNNVSQEDYSVGESFISSTYIQNPSNSGNGSNINNNMKDLQSNALKREIMKENINTLQQNERSARGILNNKSSAPVKPPSEANVLRRNSSISQNPLTQNTTSINTLRDRADCLGLSQDPVPDPKVKNHPSDPYSNMESVSPLRKSMSGVTGPGTSRSPFHERSNSSITGSTRRASVIVKPDEKNRVVAEDPPQSPYRAPQKIAAAPARKSEPGSPFMKRNILENKSIPTPERGGSSREEQFGKGNEICYKEKLTENIIESMLNKEKNEELLRAEKRNLQEQVKRLVGEVQETKYRNLMYENENKELKESLQRERVHYQSELLKISEKIKKLKNIQMLYLKEKESSERIENQLISKEKQSNEYRNKLLKIIQDLIAILKSRSNPFENLRSDRCENYQEEGQDHIMSCILSIVSSLGPLLNELNLEKEVEHLKESFLKNDSTEETRPLQKNFLTVKSTSSLIDAVKAGGNQSSMRPISTERQPYSQTNSKLQNQANKISEQSLKGSQPQNPSTNKSDYKPLNTRLGNPSTSENNNETTQARKTTETPSAPSLLTGKNNPLLSNDSFADKEKLWQGSLGHNDLEEKQEDFDFEGNYANNLENYSDDKIMMGTEFILQNELSETFQVLEEKIHQINNQMKSSAAAHQESCRRIDDPNFDQELSRNKKDKVPAGNMRNSISSNTSKDGEILEGFRLRIEEEKRKRAEEARSINDTGEISLDSQKLNPAEIKASITSQIQRLMSGIQESQRQSSNNNQGANNSKHIRQNSSQIGGLVKKTTSETRERHYSNISDLIHKPIEDSKKEEPQLRGVPVKENFSEPKTLNEIRQRQTSVDSKRTNPPESSKKTYANESFGSGETKSANYNIPQQQTTMPCQVELRPKPNAISQSQNGLKNQDSERDHNLASEDKPDKAEYAIAKFDFAAQKENDLTFAKGDRIQVLKKTKNGWWIGLFKNKIGYFPYNFVETN